MNNSELKLPQVKYWNIGLSIEHGFTKAEKLPDANYGATEGNTATKSQLPATFTSSAFFAPRL